MSPFERFETINRERLRRTRDCLSPRQQIFIDLVPLLFHTNHPLLPGYVSQATPSGISGYTPSRAALSAAKRIAKAFQMDRRPNHRPAVQGIYLMGSTGTVAYSRNSDFDIWLCHAPELETPELRLLQEKAREVERWAGEIGLEVHFFPIHAERFRRGETLSMSAESSGSSQFHLLLDEFYRSGLVVAGLRPIWWLVPPDEDHRYDDYVRHITTNRVVNAQQYIDFGGLSKVPAEEFFGAAVWQMSKSIQSPFKSVQKLLLMEAYAAEHPHIELVAHRYKQAVYNGEIRLNELDPYLQMYRKVEQYLSAAGDATRLAVLQRSFYLKAHDKLSRPVVASDPEWRRAILEGLVANWDWQRPDLENLDNCENWKVESVLRERRDLVKALSQCYAKLSDFARAQSGNLRITEQDLHVLGRKLYVAFDRKPGKVELVNHGITQNLYEEELSLHYAESQQSNGYWVLYRGRVGPEAAPSEHSLKRDQSLIELLAWCHFNRLSNTRTWWQLYPGSSQLTPTELRAAMRFLDENFPNGRIPPATNDSLGKAPSVQHAIVFANLGSTPTVSRVREGDIVTSARNDAFRYGGQGVNLALDFDLVIATSWEEVYCYHYRGIEGLLKAVREYLRRSPLVERVPPPKVVAGCFSSQYSSIIERRTTQLFEEVRSYFYEEPLPGSRSFIFEVEHKYYLFSYTAGAYHVDSFDAYGGLLAALGRTRAEFCEARFDRDSLQNSPLPEIYAANRPNRIQVFIEMRERKANVYVLDEFGSLVTQTDECRSIDLVISHFNRFFESTRKQLLVRESHDVSHVAELAVDYFQIKRDKSSRFQVHRIAHKRESVGYLELKVVGELSPNGERLYTVYCGNAEFSTLNHGGNVLTAAAQHIRAMRQSNASYPVYITDIDLSRELQEQQGITILQSAHLLNHKKRLEYHLTKALQEG